jgi:hypothetical protein
MSRERPGTIAIALCALAFAACNNGGSPTAGIDRGGVTTPVTAEGPITGFGSIVVNGVHYDIDRAAIRIDGETASGADLALGQLVTVVGERDDALATGVATSVSLMTNVRGIVENVDAAASRLTVLGQPVLVGASTVLDLGPTQTLASLNRGDVVAVSGFVGGGGLIDATRIERAPTSAESLVVGAITAIDVAALRFAIGSLNVDYSGAVLVDGFPSGGPRLGDRVVVKGTTASPDATLIARELYLVEESEQEQGQGREAEVEGLISRFVSPADFDVSGRRASASGATVYEGGSSASLALNVKVKVDGIVDAAGVIAARKIEVKDGGRVVGDDD